MDESKEAAAFRAVAEQLDRLMPEWRDESHDLTDAALIAYRKLYYAANQDKIGTMRFHLSQELSNLRAMVRENEYNGLPMTIQRLSRLV